MKSRDEYKGKLKSNPNYDKVILKSGSQLTPMKVLCLCLRPYEIPKLMKDKRTNELAQLMSYKPNNEIFYLFIPQKNIYKKIILFPMMNNS